VSKSWKDRGAHEEHGTNEDEVEEHERQVDTTGSSFINVFFRSNCASRLYDPPPPIRDVNERVLSTGNAPLKPPEDDSEEVVLVEDEKGPPTKERPLSERGETRLELSARTIISLNRKRCCNPSAEVNDVEVMRPLIVK